MKFSFTDEQAMLRDSSAAFLNDRSPLARVREVMASDAGFDQTLWQQITGEMYWQAILVPEEQGGLGLGFVESVIVLEQIGLGLTPVPLAPVMVSTLALASVGSTPRTQQLLEGIAAGRVVVLAHTAARPHWGEQGVGNNFY